MHLIVDGPGEVATDVLDLLLCGLSRGGPDCTVLGPDDDGEAVWTGCGLGERGVTVVGTVTGSDGLTSSPIRATVSA